MTILTLILPADWPQQRRDCPWLLHDAAGRVLRQGCSEPAHWPAPPAGSDGPPPCRLLLAGRQVAAHRVRLPAPPLGHRPDVVAAALEDSLLETPTQLLFAVHDQPAPDGSSLVGVMAHGRLAALVKLLRELGWSPQAAWPLGMASNTASAWACGESLCVVSADTFIELACDGGLAAWLDLVAPEQTLTLVSLDNAPERDARLNQITRLRTGTPPPLAVPTGCGFLHGDLAPPRRPAAFARHFAPAGRLAAGFAATLFVVSALQWSWHAWQARQLRSSISAHFRAIQPQAAMVDPVRQMTLQVATARRAAGQLAADDFLALAETLGDLGDGGLELNELVYENGRLQVSGTLSAQAGEQLATAAGQRAQQLQGPAVNPGQPTQFTLSAGAGS